MKITRDVVSDLWPVYQSGEASADTRAVVEQYLEKDPEFARVLRQADSAKWLAPSPLTLEPDHEMKALSATKKAILAKNWPLFFAMLFSCFAFGRIVSDTSWDVSPRNFVVMASIAGVFWVLFLVRFARALRKLAPKT
jgi:anti-sigma factor RsiW